VQHCEFAGGGVSRGFDRSAGARRKRSGTLVCIKDPGMNEPAIANSSSRPSASPPYRIAVVEDLLETRQSLVQLLQTFAEFDCVCACANGEEALKQIPLARPDVVLMDIYLPEMSGIECTAQLKVLLPKTQILILTSAANENLVFPALKAGADGYLLKHSEPVNLRAALLDLVGGGVPMTSGIARRVVEYFRDETKVRDKAVHLSPREKELLTLLSKGYTNKEIAKDLSLSVETIHEYLKNIYEKMHVRSRTEAVVKYITMRPN
jgi:DNA-binding NarL/FixJ family response regulator